MRNGLILSVDLAGDGDLVGYRAQKFTGVIDVDSIAEYDPRDFWEQVHVRDYNKLILDPNQFYILASREKIRIPLTHAAEMVPYDPNFGEFRIHYAGFFDPGFGYGASEVRGTRAVLEVRAHEVPFLIEHGQIMGRLMYIPLLSRPDKIYGTEIGSSYQRQGLALSKQFKAVETARSAAPRS